MDVSDIVTALISLVAVVIAITTFILGRRDRALSKRLEAERLIDEVFRLVADESSMTFKPEQLSRRGDARSLIERAAMLDRSSPSVLLFQGYIHEGDGNKDAARRCFELLLRNKQSRWKGYMALGKLMDGEESRGFYSQALECDPARSAEPLYMIGDSHKRCNNVDQAVASFEACVKENNAYAPAHWALGAVCRARDQVVEAKMHLERAIEVDPTHTDAMVDLGALLIAEHRWDDGRAWIEQAMRTSPADSFPHQMLGALYGDAKKPGEALEHYERAMVLNPILRLEEVDAGVFFLMTDLRRTLVRELESRAPEEGQ